MQLAFNGDLLIYIANGNTFWSVSAGTPVFILAVMLAVQQWWAGLLDKTRRNATKKPLPGLPEGAICGGWGIRKNTWGRLRNVRLVPRMYTRPRSVPTSNQTWNHAIRETRKTPKGYNTQTNGWNQKNKKVAPTTPTLGAVGATHLSPISTSQA